MDGKKTYELIVIGASFGGINALNIILKKLNHKFEIPIVIVIHQAKNSDSKLLNLMKRNTTNEVVEPFDKENILREKIYLAPSDYHLLIEKNKTFSYSYSEPVNYARPSIDMLFETAAETFGEKLVSVLLTGANEDGSKGILSTSLNGGLTLVQDPSEAEAPAMPESALKICKVNYVLSLNQISEKLNSFCYG